MGHRRGRYVRKGGPREVGVHGARFGSDEGADPFPRIGTGRTSVREEWVARETGSDTRKKVRPEEGVGSGRIRGTGRITGMGSVWGKDRTHGEMLIRAKELVHGKESVQGQSPSPGVRVRTKERIVRERWTIRGRGSARVIGRILG